MPAVFLTIDTEWMWRHHTAGLTGAAIHQRSVEPAGVGLAWQLATLARHGLKATFFVDPMPAEVFGVEPIAAMVGAIRSAGQEVQLHIHPNWQGATRGDHGADHGDFELTGLSAARQRDLIARAAQLLEEAGAERPVAFRAGSYAADDATLAALAALGMIYDSSHNGDQAPWPSGIALPRSQIAPVVRHGVIEVPVTVIEDRPGVLRNAQICALSAGEMRAALDHAIAFEHASFCIVGHSFELADRSGMRANRVHVARFEALCDLLVQRRDMAPTVHFADRPVLALTRDDRPLPFSALRRRRRQAEQLWSAVVEERRA